MELSSNGARWSSLSSKREGRCFHVPLSCVWLVVLLGVPAGAAFSTGRIHVKWKTARRLKKRRTEKQEHATGVGRGFPACEERGERKRELTCLFLCRAGERNADLLLLRWTRSPGEAWGHEDRYTQSWTAMSAVTACESRETQEIDRGQWKLKMEVK